MSKKCVILNPYNQTLKVATIEHNLKNWYAIIGTEHIGVFILDDGFGTSCIYDDDFQMEHLYGTQFSDWGTPVSGILIFTGKPDRQGEVQSITDEAIQQLNKAFRTAKVGRLETVE